jgi:hypothetical protein
LSRRISTCYIAAPYDTNLEVLIDSLEARGIRVLTHHEIALGYDWLGEARKNIAQADLVIGVLTPARRSDWMLFEIGQAFALDRQIILIAPRSVKAIPNDLRGLLVLRTGLSNRAAFDFALDQVLASPERTTEPKPIAKSHEYPGLGPKANQYLAELETALARRDWRALESIAATALRESGADVVVPGPGEDKGIDLAVWSDALEPFIGNPLLIEIKARLPDVAHARVEARRMAAAVVHAGTPWGLLLYADGPPVEFMSKGFPPTVLLYSFRELLEGMRTRSFVELIRDARNARVHGGRT